MHRDLVRFLSHIWGPFRFWQTPFSLHFIPVSLDILIGCTPKPGGLRPPGRQPNFLPGRGLNGGHCFCWGKIGGQEVGAKCWRVGPHCAVQGKISTHPLGFADFARQNSGKFWGGPKIPKPGGLRPPSERGVRLVPVCALPHRLLPTMTLCRAAAWHRAKGGFRPVPKQAGHSDTHTQTGVKCTERLPKGGGGTL